MANPTEVHLREADQALEILWDDASRDTYALAYLRGWCPCAKCQGHFAGTMKFQEGASTTLVSAEPVGGYAMRLIWADGHKSGLFAFAYLKQIASAPPAEGPTNASLLEGS
ncbi:MAG: DUF971 family protein [Bradymonadia bacterium]|jgi:DUF971 family protein